MFYNDFTLNNTGRSESLLGTSSVISISKTDTKILISLHKNFTRFFAELYSVLSAQRRISLNRHSKNVIITDSYFVL